MIHVDRNAVSRPEVLSPDADSLAQHELGHAKEFFVERREPRRFEFKAGRHEEVSRALITLFHGKCAYCETMVAVFQPVDIELFRPKARVAQRPEHPGYWWLAAVWENMYPSCAVCNQMSAHEGVRIGKANRFPLEDESKRAFLPGDEKAERPLLLDPCTDFPEDHLLFNDEGTVVSATLRGQTTISFLGLNRQRLVEARANAARHVRSQILHVLRSSIEKFGNEKDVLNQEIEPLKRLTDPSEEFARNEAAVSEKFFRAH